MPRPVGCDLGLQRRQRQEPSPVPSSKKFKAAQAKAKLSGVGALTQKDIEGLSREQIKQLRGY